MFSGEDNIGNNNISVDIQLNITTQYSNFGIGGINIDLFFVTYVQIVYFIPYECLYLTIHYSIDFLY